MRGLSRPTGRPAAAQPLLLGAICLLALLAGGGCKSQRPSQTAVAHVNGQPIERVDFEAAVGRNLRRYGGEAKTLHPGMHARIQQSVLKFLVEEHLVAQKADALGFAVSDQELQEKLTAHRERFRSPESYRDYLTRSNSTEDELRDELRKSLLRDRVVDRLGGEVQVSAEDVAAYYSDNPEHFMQPERLHVHRLWLGYPANAGAKERHAVLARAKKLRSKIHGDNFAELCRAHSEAPEAAQGGDLGLSLAGRFPELNQAMADGLAIGAVSQPMASTGGVAIFRVDEHLPREAKPMAEVESSIRAALTLRRRTEQREQVLRSLHEEAKVDIALALETPALPSATPAEAIAAPAARAPGGRLGESTP